MRIGLLVFLPALLLGAEPERILWSRTPEAFAGKMVLVRLTSGTTIEGYWAGVTPDSFSMRVEDTSNKLDISKGLQTLPRSAIQNIRAGRRRVRGRVIGFVSGLYVSSVIAGEEAQGPAAIAVLAATMAGYFVGRSFDHATREVILLPDQP